MGAVDVPPRFLAAVLTELRSVRTFCALALTFARASVVFTAREQRRRRRYAECTRRLQRAMRDYEEKIMANITVRNEQPQQKPALTRPSTWSPFRSLRDMLEWDPFREMAPILGREGLEFAPDFDVKETDGQYVFKADVPGIQSKDIDVSISGNRLTINGKRESEKEEKGETYYACERSYGSFMRAFTLPEGANADAISADLKDGVLTISVGKKAEVQPKKIPVGTPAAKH